MDRMIMFLLADLGEWLFFKSIFHVPICKGRFKTKASYQYPAPSPIPKIGFRCLIWDQVLVLL